MVRKMVALVIIATVILMAGCGGQAKPAVETKPEQKPAAAPKETITIKLSHVLPEIHPSHKACLEFREYVETNADGKVKVEVYPNAQLGSDRQAIEAVQIGTLQMTFPALAVVAGFDKSVMVFDLPYLFKDRASAYEALDGELGNRVADNLPGKNIRLLAYLENGFRHITNNRNPIVKPDDLKGLKIRTMENPLHLEAFRQLGANPTPMAFGELYTALQQKTVDGQENPIAIIHSNKFYEVQKYLSLTGHFYAAAPFLINDKFFQGLPKDVQKIVADASVKARDNQRKELQRQEQDLVNEIKAAGTQVNEPTPEEKQKFVDATQSVYEKFKSEIGADLVELAIKARH